MTTTTPGVKHFGVKPDDTAHKAAKDKSKRVQMEQVQSVAPGGRVFVGGQLVPVSGRVTTPIKAGDIVAVIIEEGVRKLIVRHEIRKAQHAPKPLEEVAAGDVQILTTGNVDADQSGIIFASANLGEFAVNVEKEPLSVPAGFSGVTAKWCQDDPSIVMWIGADTTNKRIGALMFRIKGRNKSAGKFGHTGDRIETSQFGPLPEVNTELISLIFWDESEVILRRVTAKASIAETAILQRFDRIQTETVPDMDASLAFEYTVVKRVDPPLKTVDFFGNITGDLAELKEDIEYSVRFSDMQFTTEYYCVVSDTGVPEVLALITREKAIDDKDFLPSFPSSLGVVLTGFRFNASGSGVNFNITAMADGVFSETYPRSHQDTVGAPNVSILNKSSYVPGAVNRNPVIDWMQTDPIYILNLSTKTVVARTIVEDVTIEWRTEIGSGAQINMTTVFDRFGTFNFKTGISAWGPGVGFIQGPGSNHGILFLPGGGIQIDPGKVHIVTEGAPNNVPFVGYGGPPDHQGPIIQVGVTQLSAGPFKPTPNPYTTEPWLSEFDNVPETGNTEFGQGTTTLIASPYEARLSRFLPIPPFPPPGTSGFTNINATGTGIRYGRRLLGFLNDTVSTPTFPNKQGYISGLNVFLQNNPSVRPELNPAAKEKSIIAEWLPELNQVKEITEFGENFFPFQSNVRWGLASLGIPNSALYDRQSKTVRNIAPKSIDKFGENGSLIGDLVMSPARLFQVSADKKKDRVLIKVGVNDAGQIEFIRTKDVEVTRSPWPDFFVASETTAVIFPRRLEGRGNP